MSDFIKMIREKLVGEEMTEKPIMKVCMLGARGVGKTSVLTSMYSNLNHVVNATNIHLTPESGTGSVLDRKLKDLKSMFSNHSVGGAAGGIAGDNTESIFEFNLGMNSENVNMGLELRDYPGEYVVDYPEKVKEYIYESNAIIIAIDTPYLMEEDGRYNGQKNRVGDIISFFRNAIKSDCDDKLVIFVPLKCEKYYHEGRIEEVTNKVKAEYSEIIDFLRDRGNIRGLEGKFACVITPILTVGEIIFDRFEEIDGQMVSKYKYLKPGAKFSPRYCEQPLLYLLAFVCKQYLNMKKQKESKGILTRLRKFFALNPQANNMLIEIQRLSVHKNENVEGYTVCFGRGKV